MTRLLRSALLLLLVLLVACSPARREIGRNQDAIRKVQFSGNGAPLSGHNDLQLAQQLETQDTSFGLMVWPLLYWVDPKVLDPEILRRDAYRLEVWYAHHGWFDAKVTGWEVDRVRAQGRRRGGIVDIRGIVEPGKPSTVRTYTLAGLDKPRHEPLKRIIRTEGDAKEGDQFVLAYAEADRARLLDLLYGTGFPYATVDLHIDANPDERVVDLTLTADTGIHARFGEVRISGQDKVTEQQIRDRLTWIEGKEYQVDRLRESQQALFDMGTFSSVRVEPDTSDPTVKDIPIDVQVTESKWRTLRFGVGSGVQKTVQEGVLTDGLAWSPRVSGRFRHANLFRQLIAWELRASAGVYYEPATLSEDVEVADRQPAHCFSKLIPSFSGALNGDADSCPHQLEPTWMLGTSVSWPRILGDRWGIEFDGQIERDVFVGAFPYRGIETSLAAVYRPNRFLQFRVGPAVEQSNYLFDTPEQRQALLRVYGEGFENPYILVALDQRLILDRRQLKRRTKIVQGVTYAAFGLRETLPTHATAQRYIGTDVDTRYLIPVKVGEGGYRFQTAFAVRGELLVPYTDRPVGYPERAFLGGANSVRGFRTNQLGPYDAIWNDDGTLTYLPRGGTAATQVSAEVRFPWAYDITLATFADAGILSETIPEYGLDDLRYSIGFGLRYDTLVGPIRADFSFRPLFPEDAGPERTLNRLAGFGLAPARSYDLFSGLAPNSDRHPPFALVFFIAIGEAI